MKKSSRDSSADYSDILELFEQEDVLDDDIARDMNVDIKTVLSFRQELQDEEAIASPSLFFKTHSAKTSRQKK